MPSSKNIQGKSAHWNRILLDTKRTSNSAEGVNRYSVKDKAHFIEMAFGSLMEVSSQFEIAEELGYITVEDRMSMDELIKEEARLLSGLQNSYKPEAKVES